MLNLCATKVIQQQAVLSCSNVIPQSQPVLLGFHSRPVYWEKHRGTGIVVLLHQGSEITLRWYGHSCNTPFYSTSFYYLQRTACALQKHHVGCSISSQRNHIIRLWTPYSFMLFIHAALAGGGSRQTGAEMGEPGFGGMIKTSSPPEEGAEKAYI